MIYWFLKPLAQIAFRVFFRKVYYLHEENVSKDKPVILATNHPTAFLETLLYPTYGKRPAYNLLRGDMFSKPFTRWLCRQVKTIPIFRFRDGFENMRKNQEIMDEITARLHKKQVISIMVEGSHAHVKRLRRVQKGAARIAFQTYEKYGDIDLEIVPLGVNFTDSDQFRSILMSEFGEPIFLKDFIDIYKENDRRAIKLLTKEIEQRLRKYVVHIEDEADEPFTNVLLEMNRHEQQLRRLPIFDRSNHLLYQEIAIANQINELDETEKSYLRKDVEGYQKRLHRLGLQDIGVAQPQAYRLGTSLLLALGFLPFLLGYGLNFLPLWYAKYFADKNIKKIEFHSSIRFGVGLGGYLLYYLLWIVAAILFPKWWLIATVVAMPFLGFFTLFYRDFYKKWNAARQFNHLPIDEANDIQEQRRAIMAFRQSVEQQPTS